MKNRLPPVPIERMWEMFPKTRIVLSNWLLLLRDEELAIEQRTFRYIELINDPGLFQVSIASLIKANSSGQKGSLGYDYENFSIETKPEELMPWLIQIVNPQIQDIDEQCFTICHELGHLLIGYEVCGKYFAERSEKVAFAWGTNVIENSEELCDAIADILLLRKPLV